MSSSPLRRIPSIIFIMLLFALYLHRISVHPQLKMTNSEPNDPHRQEETFVHNNRNLPAAQECTEDQRGKIFAQLGLGRGEMHFECQDSDWLESFFAEEADIGSGMFLGISVGCKKGTDAVRTARMGMMSERFDVPAYVKALGTLPTACDSGGGQVNINFPPRDGEMHCIEPMPNNVKAVRNASESLGLGPKFVIAQAAISSANGMIKFPYGEAGMESYGIDSCDKKGVSCVDTTVFSLDSYAEKFIQSKGPVNVLQIDVEGFDFDVLFGASSVLDRTYFLEFEYHSSGSWNSLHVQDAVRLLNGKGFTCYWSSSTYLWRITGCYFDAYDEWHGWSNAVCVHRSQSNLARRMESTFLETLANTLLDRWCSYCPIQPGVECCDRVPFLMNRYKLNNKTAVMENIMSQGKCIKPQHDVVPT